MSRPSNSPNHTTHDTKSHTNDERGEIFRLNKFLASRLGLSRREADDLIASGKVHIDGHPATLGARVSSANTVTLRDQPIPFEKSYTYLALNKPSGYVCSRRRQGDTPTIYELLPKKYHALKTVGRLDKDSSGLILLTDDGDFAFQMTHPRFYKEKHYIVHLDRPLAPLHQQMISDFGIRLDDGFISHMTVITLDQKNPTKENPKEKIPSTELNNPAKTHPERTAFEVILTEGKNRQIRRTFAALGYTVTSLHRTTFGPYQLSDLKPGTFIETKKA